MQRAKQRFPNYFWITDDKIGDFRASNQSKNAVGLFFAITTNRLSAPVSDICE